ncbi:MAG: D-alanine--D-alanine ligase [Coxiellaceae bacterium]|jgi:D-alanine-D-alanine ligase|nr:D-alanine--D-alanine ligase [Coxiellaceae bacterium]
MALNVAVIFGGKSVEHEISILSALQCINAIDKNKYHIVPIYVSKYGQWYTGQKFTSLASYRNLDTLLLASQKIVINQNANSFSFFYEPKGLFTKRKHIAIDIVIPLIHGTHGEDGILQGLLAMMNVPYVGCDVLVSAITMDKIVAKILLRNAGIKVLDDWWFYSSQWIDNKDYMIATIKTKFVYPLIVKPGNLGSSIGVSAVVNDYELENAIDLVVSLSDKVLIESKIINLKEINCSVLGDRDAIEVSVLEEPIRSKDILSYQDKYVCGTKNKLSIKIDTISCRSMSDAKRRIPAVISKEISSKIRDLASKAFISLNCSGVVRLDFLLDQDSNEIYLCELNTIPGSLAFYLWENSGLNFTNLIERLLALALKRHREINNLIATYDNNILKG